MNHKLVIITFSLSIVVLFGLFLFQQSKFNDGKLHIVFCNVGQGDAIFMRTPYGADILVDGGPDDKVLNCLSAHMPFWDRDLELVFATHPDADHITGLLSVLKNYKVMSFDASGKNRGTKVFKTIEEEINQEKVPERTVFSDDKFQLSDGVAIKELWPTRDFASANQNSNDTNSFSLVQLVSFGKFNMLLTGDVEAGILDKLFDSSLTLSILKLPHHGSKTGVDDKTFELLKPALSIVSAGKKNKYHHPSPEVLSLLKKYNLQYKRTDMDGEIEIVTDGVETKVVN